MSKYEKSSFVAVILSAIGWPLLWGTALCGLFYALLHLQVVSSPNVQRYFAGHPVEYIETWLFCIGVAALTAKGLNLVSQFGMMHEIELTPAPPGGQKPEEVGIILERIEEFPGYVRKSYLVQRLVATLTFVHQKRSSEGLEDELKHQSDLDVARASDSYALVRMIIWATPMLGFLGTVIGITLALGDLSPTSLVATPEKAMEGLLAGLSVAFDTTALALSLAMLLMFGQYLTNHMETTLLELVDSRVNRELIGRFGDQQVRGADPNVQLIVEMNQAVMQSIEGSVTRQAEVWNRALEESREKWNHVMECAGANIGDKLESAFQNSMREFGQEVQAREETAADRSVARWKQFEEVVKENAVVMRDQQAELARQGDFMLQAVNAAGEVSKLQQALNENLRSLTLLGKFDETVMSLSAAINLLNARIHGSGAKSERLRVHSSGERRAA